ncbi:MAG: YbhN family protein [ANME-2 cluster archaeon]|nr:YbhN family protein [ANME-2 cluster archaeon]
MNKSNNKSSQLNFIPPLTLGVGHYLPRLIILGLAVHLILPQLASLEQSLKVIESMAIWAVVLAIAAQLFSYFGSGYQLHSIIAIVHQRISVKWGVIITLAAASIGLVAGGVLGNTAATYRWVRKKGVSVEGAGLAGTLPLILNNITLIFITAIGLVYLLFRRQLSSSQTIIFILILMLLLIFIGVIIWGVRHRLQLTSLAIRMTGWWAGIKKRPYISTDTEDTMGRLFKAWDALSDGGWQRPLFGAGANIGFDMLTLYFIFIAAGYQVGPGVLLAGYGMPLLLGKMAFLIPGGVGIVEGTMAALYTGLGVPDPVVVVVILIYRLLSFWLPSLFGFPLAAYLQR